MFQSFSQDVKFAIRMMKIRPAFTAAIAYLIPAVRAARVDPVLILKAE